MMIRMKPYLFVAFGILVCVFLFIASFGIDERRAAAAPHAGPSPLVLNYQQCYAYHPGEVEIDLSWSPAGGTQWVDVSLFDNGFAPGTFVGIGPMSGLNNNVHERGFLGNRMHYVRVNSLTAYGWVATQTLAFMTLDCAPAPSALTYKLYGPVRFGCSESDMGTDTYSWETFGAGDANNQWLDISLVNNGFAPGTFVGIGPIPINRGYQAAPSVGSRSTVVYWRVNTPTARGWIASPTAASTFPILPMHNGCN